MKIAIIETDSKKICEKNPVTSLHATFSLSNLTDPGHLCLSRRESGKILLTYLYCIDLVHSVCCCVFDHRLPPDTTDATFHPEEFTFSDDCRSSGQEPPTTPVSETEQRCELQDQQLRQNTAVDSSQSKQQLLEQHSPSTATIFPTSADSATEEADSDAARG